MTTDERGADESRDGDTANFSPAVRAGDFVFVSGQASVGPDGQIVSGSFAEEMDRSIRNLDRILADYDADVSDIVRVTAYVHDPGHLAEYNALYRQYFSPPLPARTTITNCLTDAIKFELDAIAYVPRPDDGGDDIVKRPQLPTADRQLR